MKTYFLLFIFSIFSSLIYSQQKSFKRGVAYGHHSAADLNTASAVISWWYNWSSQPDYDIQTNYADYNVDFVPQAWNAAGISGINSWVSQDNKVKYILGFNEPNFIQQANMTPLQAAAAWPQLQAIADQYGLKLVSPAVNYCGNCVSENGTVYTNPFKWLDDFFAACPTCRVDYIALHWYGGGNSMSGYINDARKYGKPIWVTEFADWENTGVTAEIQKNYLAGTTNFLERDPDVFRYSWFIGRSSGGAATYPYLDLYGLYGKMTALGQIYLDIPVYDSTSIFQIPGRIEAEEYYKQSGLFGELTQDVDGFMNIGYTDAGDWLKYKISVTKSGTYTITSRYAGTATGSYNIYIDDVYTTTVNTTNTSGWQTWASVLNTVNLTAGEHMLKLLIVAKGFNLNWLSITEGAAGINEMSLNQLDATVYPNPVIDKKFKVTFKSFCSNDITIQILDLSGKVVYSYKIEKLNGKDIEIDLNSIKDISNGIYNLSIKSREGYMNKKIAIF
jgi:hypothetical protein